MEEHSEKLTAWLRESAQLAQEREKATSQHEIAIISARFDRLHHAMRAELARMPEGRARQMLTLAAEEAQEFDRDRPRDEQGAIQAEDASDRYFQVPGELAAGWARLEAQYNAATGDRVIEMRRQLLRFRQETLANLIAGPKIPMSPGTAERLRELARAIDADVAEALSR